MTISVSIGKDLVRDAVMLMLFGLNLGYLISVRVSAQGAKPPDTPNAGGNSGDILSTVKAGAQSLQNGIKSVKNQADSAAATARAAAETDKYLRDEGLGGLGKFINDGNSKGNNPTPASPSPTTPPPPLRDDLTREDLDRRSHDLWADQDRRGAMAGEDKQREDLNRQIDAWNASHPDSPPISKDKPKPDSSTPETPTTTQNGTPGPQSAIPGGNGSGDSTAGLQGGEAPATGDGMGGGSGGGLAALINANNAAAQAAVGSGYQNQQNGQQMAQASTAGDGSVRQGQNVMDGAGSDAQALANNTATTTAQSQNNNSWATTLGTAVINGATTGLVTTVTAFGQAVASNVGPQVCSAPTNSVGSSGTTSSGTINSPSPTAGPTTPPPSSAPNNNPPPCPPSSGGDCGDGCGSGPGSISDLQ